VVRTMRSTRFATSSPPAIRDLPNHDDPAGRLFRGDRHRRAGDGEVSFPPVHLDDDLDAAVGEFVVIVLGAGILVEKGHRGQSDECLGFGVEQCFELVVVVDDIPVVERHDTFGHLLEDSLAGHRKGIYRYSCIYTATLHSKM
jgi:hypothetical protein